MTATERAPGKRRPVAAIAGAGVSAAALLMNDDERRGSASTSGAAGARTTPADVNGSAPTPSSAPPSPTPGVPREQPRPTVSPSAPQPVSPSSDGKAAPAGYQVVEDPAGFSLAVPLGFTRKLEGPRIFYMSPGETFRIGIKVADPESGGPLAVHQRAHAKGPANNPGYRDAEVVAAHHNGHEAALWLFTWNGFSAVEGPRHTRDLCWEEGGRLYDVWVSAPVGRTAEARGYFDTAVRTFARTGAPAAEAPRERPAGPRQLPVYRVPSNVWGQYASEAMDTPPPAGGTCSTVMPDWVRV